MRDCNPISCEDKKFEALYDRYKVRFGRFAAGYVQDRLVAEDIVTDAFVYYWEHRARLDAGCDAAAYILTAVRHKCLNHLRAQQVRLRAHNEMGELQRRVLCENIRSLEICDPSRLFVAEVEMLVHKCLDELPELTRNIFTSQRLHAKSYRETALEYGITERRVETELAKALNRLRTALHDYLPAFLAAAVLERFIR